MVCWLWLIRRTPSYTAACALDPRPARVLTTEEAALAHEPTVFGSASGDSLARTIFPLLLSAVRATDDEEETMNFELVATRSDIAAAGIMAAMPIARLLRLHTGATVLPVPLI